MLRHGSRSSFSSGMLAMFALAGSATVSDQSVLAQTGSCHLLASAQSIPQGFGAAYNVFSTAKEVLLNVECGSFSNATLTVGNGQKTTYVYRFGYEWVNGGWKQIAFGGSELVANDWYVGTAKVNLSRTQAQLAEDSFVVAYTCVWHNSSWKCGCRDTSCTTNYWQLQAFRKEVLVGGDDGAWNGEGIGIFTRTHSFGNQKFGKGRLQTIRFIAEKTGEVRGVMPYLQLQPQPGYSEGDGGRITVRLFEADSVGQLGAQIGTAETIDRPVTRYGDSINGVEFKITDAVKPTIVKGKRYHWVFEQVGDSGRSSMGGIADQGSDPERNGGMVPVFGNDMVHMFGPDGKHLEVHPMKLPIFATVYTEGTHIGQMAHQGLRDDAKSVDGANRIRAVLKPTSDRMVRYLYAAPWKETDQSSKNVKVEIKDARATVLASTILPASSIGYDAPPAGGIVNNLPKERVPWMKTSLGTTLTLKAGQTYYVEFSAPSGADVWFMSMVEHHKYRGLSDRFGEVRGQFSSNSGGSWTNALYRGNPSSDGIYSVLLHYR